MKFLFAEPSHRRDDVLFRFGLAALVLALVLFSPWNYVLMTTFIMFVAGGIAEVLPRSQRFIAGICRSIALLGAMAMIVWSILGLLGYIHLTTNWT